MGRYTSKDEVLSSLFFKMYNSSGLDDWKDMVLDPKVEADKINLPFLGGPAGLRKFDGEADIRELVDAEYTYVTSPYHDTVAINAERFMRDHLGLYKANIEQCAVAAKMHPRKLVVDLLNAAFTGKDYTGSAFIATGKKHLVDGEGKAASGYATFSNLLTGALSAEKLMEAIGMLREQTNCYGEVLGLAATAPTLIIPSALELTAKKILKDYDENATSGVAKMRVMPGLKSQTAWFVADLDNPIKPFVCNTVTEPRVQSNAHELDGASATADFLRTHQYIWQVFAEYAAGYGASTRIVGSQGTGS